MNGKLRPFQYFRTRVDALVARNDGETCGCGWYFGGSRYNGSARLRFCHSFGGFMSESRPAPTSATPRVGLAAARRAEVPVQTAAGPSQVLPADELTPIALE